MSCGGGVGRLPRYKEAWLEMGKLMLDVGRPDAAISAFENILKFDRNFPGLVGLGAWLCCAPADPRQPGQRLRAPHVIASCPLGV